MKAFTELYQHLDQTNKTNEKIEVLQEYFSRASDEDKLWLLALFSGRKIKRTVKVAQLKEWACELAGFDQWLFDESYLIVGDLAETIALILPDGSGINRLTLSDCINIIRSMDKKTDDEKKVILFQVWSKLTGFQRFAFNKLITGGFRIGVSQKLMCRALSKSTGIDENILAHRLMGNWNADNTTFQQLVIDAKDDDDHSRPYPFFLAYALETDPDELGDTSAWQAEWKWDGIRGQIIVRNRQIFVWSRGEELVTDRFPEFHALLEFLPDGTVIDGEILAFKDGLPLAFQQLQTRINRKVVGKKLLADVPVVFMAYDILEFDKIDCRNKLLSERRILLQQLIQGDNRPTCLLISEEVKFHSWSDLKSLRLQSRSNLSEGIMLKFRDSVYEQGRKKGNWWKWKVDALTIDAVLLYAQTGHGRRAGLYTDFTFALWDNGNLVPFAKAYSGLTDVEIKEVDAFIKKNTKEKFGPVRSVKAELVFELAFEGINFSTRHKSGVAVRFPRIHRWRKDKKVEDADTLDNLKALIT